jgi:hypothetical protein
VNVAENVIMLRAFMGDDMTHATGTDDQDMLLHFES